MTIFAINNDLHIIYCIVIQLKNYKYEKYVIDLFDICDNGDFVVDYQYVIKFILIFNEMSFNDIILIFFLINILKNYLIKIDLFDNA